MICADVGAAHDRIVDRIRLPAESRPQSAGCARDFSALLPGIVMLVDDSIVRGTTSAQIIEIAREAGRQVYFASAAPPRAFPERVRHRHARRPSELFAADRTEDEVAKIIPAADWLVYQDPRSRSRPCATTTPRSKNSTRPFFFRRIRHG